MRGTFANVRLRNQLAPGTEGGWTPLSAGRRGHDDLRRVGEVPGGRRAVDRHRGQGIWLGSSRDWAAKGTQLLGVKAVIAESFERIHRSNLVNMGVLPLEFKPGRERRRAEADRHRVVRLARGRQRLKARGDVRVEARAADGTREGIHRHRTYRHTRGARRLPPRRHPPLRRASARARANDRGPAEAGPYSESAMSYVGAGFAALKGDVTC